jgi:hypothetical protein
MRYLTTQKIVFCIILLFSLVLIISGCNSSKKIDLSEFAEIKVTGSDGKGSAYVDVDWGSFERAITPAKPTNDRDFLSSLANLFIIESSIEYSVDKSEGLSNGDVVTLIVSWDKDVAKSCRLNFSASKKELIVRGLESLVPIDLFSDIYIEYDGIAPEATAMIRNASNDAFIKDIWYSVDNPGYLSNGDTVTITANITPEEAERQGYYVNETTKTYTVSGIDEFISSYSMIDAPTLEKMDKQARDLIETETITKPATILNADQFVYMFTYQPNLEIKELKLLYSYFFKLKDGMAKEFGDVSNNIYVVYEMTYTNDRPDPEQINTIYIPVYYSNIIKRESGNIDVDISKGKILSSISHDFDNLYRDVVIANKANYDYEEIKYY